MQRTRRQGAVTSRSLSAAPRGRAAAGLPRWALAGIAGVVVVVGVVLAYGIVRQQGTAAGTVAIAPGTPTFHVEEGGKGYLSMLHPYLPTVLHVPAGRVVAIKLTDYLGGCGLETIFPGLGVHGGDASVVVPVGRTGVVEIRAPRPGRYTFHCATNMYFGQIVSR